MSWNINIPVKDGKVVTEEITVSGTLPGDGVIRASGHTATGIGGYTTLSLTADGMSVSSSMAETSRV